MRHIYGLGETVLDLIFKNNQPIAAKPGGSVLNALVSLARVGNKVHFVSELGHDRVGNLIVDFFTDNGIGWECVQRYPDGQSSLAMAFLDDRNDATYEFYKPYPEERQLITPPHFTSDDVVLFGSFYAIDPQLRQPLVAVIKKAKAAGALIVYDPNFRASHAAKGNYKDALIENMQLADIVRGSDEDFKNILGLTSADDVYSQVKQWCQVLVVTANARGGHVFAPSVSMGFDVPPIQPVSTIGAGDNFNAGIIHALLQMNITRDSLPRLTTQQWQSIVSTGIGFSSAVCMSLDNYVPKDFSH